MKSPKFHCSAQHAKRGDKSAASGPVAMIHRHLSGFTTRTR